MGFLDFSSHLYPVSLTFSCISERFYLSLDFLRGRGRGILIFLSKFWTNVLFELPLTPRLGSARVGRRLTSFHALIYLSIFIRGHAHLGVGVSLAEAIRRLVSPDPVRRRLNLLFILVLLLLLSCSRTIRAPEPEPNTSRNPPFTESSERKMAETGVAATEENEASSAAVGTTTESPEKEKEATNATAEETPASPPPKEMRAVVLTGFGGLKSVKIMKKNEPTPGDNEVLIRVKACGLNFLDLMVRQGVIDNPPKTPFIQGFECSGEVEAVGNNVTTYKAGDKVVALTDSRAWAEAVVVPTKFVYKMPVGMSFFDAAAITMNYVVAYVLLFDIANLQKGKSVLVHSVGGGVGQAIAQLCKTVEDVTLIGVASQVKHEAIKDSVAHLIDRSHDYIQEVRKINADGVDIVLDCLGGEDCNRGYGLLKPMGKYVLYGSSSLVTGETKSLFNFAKSWWQVDKVNPLKLYDENKTIAGLHLRHLLYQQSGHDYVRSIVEKIFKLWQEGKIKPVMDSTWALEDVTEAMQKLHDRKNVGKVILDPSMEPKPKPQGKGKESKENKDKAGSGDSKPVSVESADGEEAKEGETAADSK